MATRRKEEWISGSEAAELLSAQSGHAVSDAYVRLLARKGKIRMRPKNGRENEYNKADVLSYRVRAHKQKDEEAA